MIKAVFDTNVYISAFVIGGRAEQAYLSVLQGRGALLYTSIPILAELSNKLAGKFLWGDKELKSAVQHIAKAAVMVKPSSKLNILDDEPDNRILECAVEARADCIVTGDKHLLGLKEFGGVRIITIADFLKACKPG